MQTYIKFKVVFKKNEFFIIRLVGGVGIDVGLLGENHHKSTLLLIDGLL